MNQLRRERTKSELQERAGAMKVCSLFSGCGQFDFGLAQAGHEIMMQTEADPRAREVLQSRFQGIFQPTEASSVKELPEDADVLACCLGSWQSTHSFMNGSGNGEDNGASVSRDEMETGWRESWSSNSVQSKLKQVLRLAKNRFTGRCVPWVVIDCGSEKILDTMDEQQPPIIAELVREFEQLGFRWAHRVVQPNAFGIPDDRGRLVFLASRHGDPREVLLVDEDNSSTKDINSSPSDLLLQQQQQQEKKKKNNNIITNGGPTLFLRCGFEMLENVDGYNNQFQRATPKYVASTLTMSADARPDRDSIVMSIDGQLAPLDISDAESLQGLLPGWTVVSPPGASRTSEAVVGEILNRWRALNATGGCVPLATWIGRRLSDPYGNAKGFDSRRKSAQKFPIWCDGNLINANDIDPREIRWVKSYVDPAISAQETAIATLSGLNANDMGFKWPQDAYNIGHGRVSHPMKRISKPEFLKHPEAREKTALKAYLRTTLENCQSALGGGGGGIEGYIPREVILACVRATREAGMEPPSTLAALERQFGGAAAAAAATTNKNKNNSNNRNSNKVSEMTMVHSERDLIAAETLLVTTGLRNGASPRNGTDVMMMNNHQTNKRGTPNGVHTISSMNEDINMTPTTTKRQKSSLNNAKEIKVAPAKEEEIYEPDDGSFVVAGIRMMKPRESQIVWAKLPGHPHWPGLRVDEKKHGDVVPKAAKNMQKDGADICVVFFGEKSFGWVPETAIVDFEVGYKQHSHAPSRGKSRFLNALKYATAEKELRKNPPAQANALDDLNKTTTHFGSLDANGTFVAPPLLPAANPMGAVEPIDYEIVERNKCEVELALSQGRCPCKMCENLKSIKESNPETCLRLRCISASTSGKTGAKLASQGAKAVGKMISILWPLDDARYVAEVISYDARELKHLVRYCEDDVREYVSLWEEDVQFVRGDATATTTTTTSTKSGNIIIKNNDNNDNIINSEEDIGAGVDLLLSLGS
jgi:hypothetical protein